MKMKLLLFILGLTLCASWPAFSRNLAGSSEENNEENSFLDFLDGELGEYDTFADADHDNSFDLFDLNFHLNEEGEVDTSLGEENNEEALPEEPSDEPTEETPEEPTEETPEEPAEETPEEPTEETPEEPTEETPEEPTEETPEEPTEETPEEPTEETPEEPTEETPEENTEAVVETPEENTEDTTQEEEEENNEPEDLLTQVRADAEANDVLNFGVSTIIAQGINKTKIPNDNYTVTSISNYNKTGSAKGNLYQISCVAANANGSAVLNINFTVFYQLSNQKKTLSSWSYNIKTSTPVTPTTEFAQIGQDEINTDTVQKVLNYGVAQIYAIGTQAGKISGSVLTVNNVVSVWKQATTNGFNYKFQAVLANDKVTVNANFTVALKSSNQETKLIQWSYNVKNGTPNTNNNTTAPTNNTTPSNNTTNTNTTNPNNNTGTNNNGGNTSNNTTQPTNNTNNNNNGNNSTNNNTTSNNTTQPATNNTTPANNTNNDGFVELETAEIETSGEVQGALEYGTDWIIKSGNAKGKIPVSNYTITKVNSVERKTQSNGRNAYRCDVELQDVKKVITAEFTVFVKVSTQEFSLGSWTYNISNVKTSNSNGSTNTNTNTNNNTNTSNNTNTNTSTNTTTNNNTTTQPTNTTTPTNTTNSTATDFTALTQDEINSAEVQGALNFGANRVIQIGNEKGQVPVSNYTITKVNSVGKQVASNGRNAYKCDVELQDVNKVLVKAQFVVYVKVATQERSVGAWSYQVSNKGNAPKPSTNTKTL